LSLHRARKASPMIGNKYYGACFLLAAWQLLLGVYYT
jgi:hypothetical protein